MKNRPAITVKLADPDLDRPAGPPTSGQSDQTSLLLYAEQLAGQDAKSGAIDKSTLQYLDAGLLPVELDADTRLNRQQQEASQHRDQAASTADALKQTGPVSLVANGKGLPRNYVTTTQQENEKIAAIDQSIKEVETERAELEVVMSGDRAYSDGVVWQGDIPVRPGPDTTKSNVRWSATNVKDKALTWLPLLVLGPIEAAIVVSTMMARLRTDNVVAPIAFSVAFLVGLIFLPGPIGTLGAKVFKRGFIVMKEAIQLVLMGLWWGGAVAATVSFRVSDDQARAIRKAAEAQGVPIDQIVAADVYNVAQNWLVWLIPVGLIGVAVMVAKVFGYNPVVRQIIKVDYRLVDLYASRFVHSVVKEQGEARIEATKNAAEAVVDEWETYRDEVLPAQTAEFCAHYRRFLGAAFGDPEITQALFQHKQTVDVGATSGGGDIVDGEVIE